MAKAKKFEFDYGSILDATAKACSLTIETYGGVKSEQSISSGMLCTDLIVGNAGWLPGWHTSAGFEQSAKTTTALMTLLEALKLDIPIIQVWDFEGSFDSNYITNFWNNTGEGKLLAKPETFGIRNADGSWKVKPRIPSNKVDTGEEFFNALHYLLKRLPKKQRFGEDWYLVFKDDKHGKAMVGSNFDEKIKRQMGVLAVKVPDGRPQGILMLDSYPTMNPELLDGDESNKQMASAAAMFSNNMKRVKSMLNSRKFIVLGINQMRLKPGPSFGCFQFETNILMADGTSQHIGKLVNGFERGDEYYVRSYDQQTGKFVNSKVKGVYRNGKAEPNGGFVKLVTEGMGNKSMRVTPNHLVLSADKNEMIRVADLKVGDNLLQHRLYRPFNSDQRQFILGSLLGDGSISEARYGGHYFQFNHGHKQLDYLEWKKWMFGALADGRKTKSNNTTFIFASKVSHDPYLKTLNEQYRVDTGFRSYSGIPNIIFDKLDARGLAVWFMDDGSYGGPTRKPRISIERLTVEQKKHLCKVVKRITGTKWVSRSDGITMKVGLATQTFFDVIAPYMHEMFRYKVEHEGDDKLKVRDNYFSYEWDNVCGEEQSVGYKVGVTSIEPYVMPENTSLNTKFDLEIEGTHTYVAAGCVVHNSPEYEPGGEALKLNCSAANTLLYTDVGMLTNEEFFFRYTGVKELPGVTGVSGSETPRTFQYTGQDSLMKLTTTLGHYVQGKPGHKVQVLDGKNVAPKWLTLEAIRESNKSAKNYLIPIKVGANQFPTRNESFLFEPYNLETSSPNFDFALPTEMTTDLARVIGYLTGDGHVRDGHIIFANTERKEIKRFKKAFGRAFQIDAVDMIRQIKYIESETYENGGIYNVRLYSKEIGRFLAYLGLGEKSSYTKTMPWSIRCSTRDCNIAFLSAYFDCDGSAETNQISVSSRSPTLIHQIQATLLNLGIVAKASYSKAYFKSDKEVMYGYGYSEGNVHANSLTMYGHAGMEFSRIVGFRGYKKDKFQGGNRGTKIEAYRLPILTGWRSEGLTPVLVKFMSTLGIRNQIYPYNMPLNWYVACKEFIATLRTEQERSKNYAVLEKFNELISYTVTNKLIWVPLQDVTYTGEMEHTYDLNMPVTSTIVTNGIVSHNSEIRIKHFPHTAPPNEFRVVGTRDGINMIEKGVNGGTDTYKYIKLTTIKNKVGGAPAGSQIYQRVWVSDEKGEARGLDPVFDAYQFMKLIGMVEGNIKKFTWKPKWLKGVKVQKMTIIDLKVLMFGETEAKQKLCKKFGIEKNPKIQENLRKMLVDGSAYSMFKGGVIEEEDASKDE